jgi:hypothetical protein
MTGPQDASRRNQHERADSVERVLRSVDPDLDAHAYSVRREELAARYGDTTVALPNETESLGDVFDRLTDAEYETAREARAAAVGEIAGVSLAPEGYTVERPVDPEHAGRLGTDPVADEPGSPVDADPPSDPDAVADEPDPVGVYDGAEAVEPHEREPDDAEDRASSREAGELAPGGAAHPGGSSMSTSASPSMMRVSPRSTVVRSPKRPSPSAATTVASAVRRSPPRRRSRRRQSRRVSVR